MRTARFSGEQETGRYSCHGSIGDGGRASTKTLLRLLERVVKDGIDLPSDGSRPGLTGP